MRVARSAILALLTVAVFAPGIARAAGSIVLVRSGDETIQTYLALPEKPAKGGPAIVLVHEWWGLSDWVKGVADRHAAQGYPEISPDLKSREDLAPSSALSNRAPVM